MSTTTSSSETKKPTTTTTASTKIVKTVNPATGQIIKEYPVMTKDDIEHKAKKARSTFQEWRKDIGKRSDFLHYFAIELRKNKEALARLATTEMGKVIKEARSEVEKCAWVVDYYADNSKSFLSDQIINTDARKSFVSFDPIGVIGSIMPWNFPYWQALRFAAPSLMVGNTVVLKPSSSTTECGIKIEETFIKAGAPEGVFQTVVGNSTVAENLIDSNNVVAVTFTGSVPVGAKVAQRATSKVKKTVLELGGSDPFIVCNDADIEKASDGAIKGRFINCGQSCIASKRFIVTKQVANEFTEQFVQKAEKLRIGDPLSDETDIGPLVREDALKNMEDIVADSIKNGAKVLTGGERVDKSKGYFYKPTIVTNIFPKMRIIQEEVFGPVAPIVVAEDDEEAIKLANDTEYGLGASIWTQDLDKAERMSRMIEAGVVTVNSVVASDPRVPFGGVKKSGFGRELSRYGMLEFANIKSVRFYRDLVPHEHHVE